MSFVFFVVSHSPVRTKDELVALGKQLGVYLDASKPKPVLIQILQHAAKPLALPKELAKGISRKSRNAA